MVIIEDGNVLCPVYLVLSWEDEEDGKEEAATVII